MTANIKIRQNAISIEPQKFDTADILVFYSTPNTRHV